jgi:hypothetical protein
MPHRLLTRTVFRETVLQRAGGACCVPGCVAKAVDAHHILNRNLFTKPEEFGGYFEANGAQLCNTHHYEAEFTHLTTAELRDWCSVPVIVPSGWDETKNYDTWGNEIVSEYSRIPGPLFHDEGFQKILKLNQLGWQFY